MEVWISLITDFVRQHQVWAIPIVFLLAFGESLAFLSLLLPATIILLGMGALIGEAGIPFWPIYLAAVAGGFFGDWLSYWVGDHYQHRVYGLWPFTRHPAMLKRGHVFFCALGDSRRFSRAFFRPAAGGSTASCRALRYAAAWVPVS